LYSAAANTNSSRHLKGSEQEQLAGLLLLNELVLCEGLVLAIAGGPSMGTGFNGAPVLAECDGSSINTVHDSLVMGSSTILVLTGKGISLEDALGDVDAVESLVLKERNGEEEGGASTTLLAQVGYNSYYCTT
jgi:hypothetical protein